VPRAFNGAQPSQPSSDRTKWFKTAVQPEAPGSIRTSATGAGSHLTRLSLASQEAY